MYANHPNDLLTADEVAKHLRVSPGTILAWSREGRIPAQRLSYKVLRFAPADVLAALEAGYRAKPGTPPPIDPNDADAQSNELVTERDLREVWEPELVDQIIDHQRHSCAPDGTRVWVRAEVLALSGSIEATKGAR